MASLATPNSPQRDYAMQKFRELEQHFGCDLVSIFDSANTPREAMAEFRRRIIPAINNHPALKDLSKLSDDDVEANPNIVTTQYNGDIIRNYTGDDVETYVKLVADRLSIVATSTDDTSFVASTVSGVLLTVGVNFAIQLGKGLIIGFPLRTALLTAVQTLSLNACVAAVVIAVAAILIYFAFFSERNMLGVFLNDTDTTYVVPKWRNSVDGYDGGNLYMEHGITSSFPEDHDGNYLDDPLIQLTARYFFPAKPTDPQTPKNTYIAQGLFYAEKKAGFYGAEGVYIFIPYEGGGTGFACQFAVPFSKDNRCNIQTYANATVDDKGTMQRLFRDMYNNAGVNEIKTSDGFTLTARMDGVRGSSISGVFSISDRPLSSSTGELLGEEPELQT